MPCPTLGYGIEPGSRDDGDDTLVGLEAALQAVHYAGQRLRLDRENNDVAAVDCGLRIISADHPVLALDSSAAGLVEVAGAHSILGTGAAGEQGRDHSFAHVA